MVSTGYSLYYPLEIPYVTIDSQMFLGQSALSFFTYFYLPQYIAINSTRPLAAINWLMFLGWKVAPLGLIWPPTDETHQLSLSYPFARKLVSSAAT